MSKARTALILAACLLLPSNLPAVAADLDIIAAKKRIERKTFTNAEIADGFFRTAFGAEHQLAGRVDRVRKFDGPIRVFVEGPLWPERRAQIARVITDVARHVRHLDLALVHESAAANVIVRLVRDRDLFRTISALYGVEHAREIRKSLDPQCLSGFRKNERYEIERADVILTIDNGEFTFLDCAYEEMLQSLGPINDTDKVPWTMFNDDVSMGYFDVYDQFLLNILYDPRIRPGMTREEAEAALPAVLADVRPWVAKVNGLAE